MKFAFLLLTLVLLSCSPKNNMNSKGEEMIRFASYNVSMYRSSPGELGQTLKLGQDSAIQNVAAVIQNNRPDVLVLCEFDFDTSGELLDLFCSRYLEKSQHEQDTIQYPHRLQIPSNTGLISERDINEDGKIKLPEDAYGFGRYEGQYAFAILSKYPLEEQNIKSFQTFLWKDMPDPRLPVKKNGQSWYNEEVLSIFRLSSKNHVDIPVRVTDKKTIHAIVAHPTPPVFDGPEDRNGLRNYDELKLIYDYISDEEYLIDDRGRKGGLESDKSFVILGDLNADPIDGASVDGAISQLLDHPRVNQEVSNGILIPESKGGEEHNRRKNDKGHPKYDTSFFGARIDYALPSKDLKAVGSGIFWPGINEPHHHWVADEAASDHLLVWVDLIVKD